MSKFSGFLSPRSISEDIYERANELAALSDNLRHSLSRFQPKPIGDFHEIIKKKRKSLEMSGELVAELSGISTTAYRNIEANKTGPKRDTVRAISETLGLDLCII